MKFFILSFLLLSVSCSEITPRKGSEIVEKSIAAHGGWNMYQLLENIVIDKTTFLYNEEGLLLSKRVQHQSFKNKPSFQQSISWQENGKEYNILYDGKQLKRLHNQRSKLFDTIKAMRQIRAAEFVFFQPFMLRKSNAEITYKGKTIIMDSIAASEVQVQYPNSSDIWWFYFDDNYKCVAQKVFHNNRYSLIENLKFQNYKGLLFNKLRKSYSVDRLGSKKYLIATYVYDIR